MRLDYSNGGEECTRSGTWAQWQCLIVIDGVTAWAGNPEELRRSSRMRELRGQSALLITHDLE